MLEWPRWHVRSFFARRRLCKPSIRPCCKRDNKEVVQLSPNLTVAVCRDCGSRHFEMTANPGRAFSQGERL